MASSFLHDERVNERLHNSQDSVVQSRQKKESSKSKLKNDVKIASTFVKRLGVGMTTDETFWVNLIKDVEEKVYLARYVDEIANAIAKASLRLKDIRGATSFASCMHQSYGGFTNVYVEQLEAQFDIAVKGDEVKDVVRRRVLVRLIGEAFLVGLIGEPSVVVKAVRLLTRPGIIDSNNNNNNQMEDAPLPHAALANLQAVVGFAKACGSDLLQADGPLALPEPARARCASLLTSYLLGATKYLVMERAAVRRTKAQHQKDTLRRGEVSEAAIETLARRERGTVELYEECVVLAGVLGCEPPPPLPSEFEEPEIDQDLEASKAATLALWSRRRDETQSPEAWVFGDEETRAFYQDLTDTFDVLQPLSLTRDGMACLQKSIVLRLEGKSTKEVSDAAVDLEVTTTSTEAVDNVDNNNNEKGEDEDDEPLAQAGHSVETLMTKLNELLSERAVDEFVIDFVQLNSKAARKRVIQELSRLRSGRMELAPFYARLAAQLSRLYVDIGPSIVQVVESSYARFLRDQKPGRATVRATVSKHLGELVKFGLGGCRELGAAPIVAFRTLRRSLEAFQGENVDATCTFLETCGRELYRIPHTHEETRKTLEAITRQRNSSSFNRAQEATVDNALFYCVPLEAANVLSHQRVLSDIEEYVRWLLLERLGSGPQAELTAGKHVLEVWSALQKLPWNDRYLECEDAVARTVMAACKSRAQSIPGVVQVVRTMAGSYPHAGTRVLDDLFESIADGLERNDFRMSQRRVGHMLMLGHAFRLTLVQSPAFWDCLFGVLQRGHASSSNSTSCWQELGAHVSDSFAYETPCAWDLPWDGFRIRLVCAALDAAHEAVVMPTEKKRLLEFISHLDLYVWSKAYLPVDMECTFLDALSFLNRRSLELCKKKRLGQDNVVRVVHAKSRQEAQDRVAEMKQKRQSLQFRRRQQQPTTTKGSSRIASLAAVAEEGVVEEEEHDDDNDNNGDDDESNELEKDTAGVLDESNNNDAEFDAEFEKMVRESLEIGSKTHLTGQAVSGDNLALPLGVMRGRPVTFSQVNEGEQPSTVLSLLKRGGKGKVEIKSLVVPSHTILARAAVNQVSKHSLRGYEE